MLAALVAVGCGGAGGRAFTTTDDAEQVPELTVRKAGEVVPGRYIVVLKEGVSPVKVARAYGVVPEAVFSKALNGFAGAMSADKAKALESDPSVKFVEPDRVVTLVLTVGMPRIHSLPSRLHTNPYETLTTGIDRIDAELNPRTDVSDIGIAIIDTGIWKTHVDLNVAGGVNFTSKNSSKWNDDNGHGTHVAGIAAAKTNDNKGVRGVAPNARLYAVKVLNRNGTGFLSWVIASVDWVTNNAAGLGIKVANMSLGFMGTSDALNTAISNSVQAGVTYVVAAGNSSTDASLFNPANHPDVITSTWKGDKKNPGGLYATLLGTSMSSPHVAGAAAQYLASNPGASPADVRNALIQLGIPQSQPCSVELNGGFTGDPDDFPEPLAYAKNL